MSLLASPFAPPIRFLLLIVFGYGALRVFSVMPLKTPGAAPAVYGERGTVPSVNVRPAISIVPSVPSLGSVDRAIADARIVQPSSRWLAPVRERPAKGWPQIAHMERTAEAPLAPTPNNQKAMQIAKPVSPITLINSPDTLPDAPAKLSTGFSGYGWVLWRGSGVGSPQLPSLGGSQAGLRLDWHWRDAFAIFGRLAVSFGRASVDGQQREGAIGIAYLPFRDRRLEVVAERRISLGGGRDAWQLRAAGGKEWLVKGWRLEAYGQVGLTGLRRRDGFAEGQVSVRKPIIKRGETSLSLGGGAWGAAQLEARRLDIGPQAVAEFKLGAPMRLSADYRIRVAGNAKPASGPALTLSTSF